MAVKGMEEVSIAVIWMATLIAVESDGYSINTKLVVVKIETKQNDVLFHRKRIEVRCRSQRRARGHLTRLSFVLSLRLLLLLVTHQLALVQLFLLLLRNTVSIQRRLVRRCAALNMRETASVRLIGVTCLDLSHLCNIRLAREPSRATAPNTPLQRTEHPKHHTQQIKRNARLHRIKRLDRILLRQLSSTRQVYRPIHARQRSPEHTYDKVPEDERHALDGEEAVEAQGEDGQQADDQGVDFVGDWVGGLVALVQRGSVDADFDDGAGELKGAEGCAGVDAC